MSLRLSDRRWRITVGDVDVSDLDIEFTITKSTKREPNECEVLIYNMSENTRSRVENRNDEDIPNRITVRLGYRDQEDHLPVVFVGDARRVLSRMERPDIITTVHARDFGRSFQNSRINKSYSPDTPVSSVLNDLIDAMGVGRGNLREFEEAFRLRNQTDSFPDGYTMSGPVRKYMNNIIRGAGYRWSIQNNALQIMRRGEPLQLQEVLLSAATGLIGSPTKDEKGVVNVVSLIQPGLDPGRRVRLDSRIITGEFEIKRVEYTGQTKGDDWYATLELRPRAR